METFIQRLTDLIVAINNPLAGILLVVVLMGLGLYFSVKLKFVQFRYMPLMFKLLTESAIGKNGGVKQSGVSSFEAFAISIASRAGTGNVAGVAIAISVGGPGSVFWMWLTALLGMASAFVESVLAQMYKKYDRQNRFIGGPAFYIRKALKNHALGVVFAILISVTYGIAFNMAQVNTIAQSLEPMGLSAVWVGLFIALFTAIIIMGGVRSIAKVASIFVPTLAFFYLLLALVLVVLRISLVPSIFFLIIKDGFTGQAVAGGVLGTVIAQGVRRGLFSNEAGLGSAPNAAAAAETKHPVNQGLIQSLSVFTDTILVCSATAFLILTSQVDITSLTGIQLTQAAMTVHLGIFGEWFVAASIFIFASSTIIGNYYYAENNIKFITDKHGYLVLFRILVAVLVFFGAIAEFTFVWAFADLFMTLMALVNLYAIYRLFPLAKLAFKNFSEQYKSGKTPVFYRETLDEIQKQVPKLAIDYQSETWPAKDA